MTSPLTDPTPPEPTAATVQDVPLDQIRLDGHTQARVTLDDDLIQDYAEQMAEGERFPPVVVFRDAEGYWVGDGHHRCRAAQQVGFTTIRAEVRDGGQREARLHACGANAHHGSRRTDGDKQYAVMLLLTDEEWGRCRVSHPYVAKLRAARDQMLAARDERLTGNVTSERTYTTKHGTVATMDTARIGAGANGRGAGPDAEGPSQYQQATARRRAREQAEFEAWLREALAQLPPPFVEALEHIQTHIRGRLETLPPDKRVIASYQLSWQLQRTLHSLALDLHRLAETYREVFGEPEPTSASSTPRTLVALEEIP